MSDGFLGYVRTPLNGNRLDKIYKDNGVVYERVALYNDFSKSLISKILDTYMGDKYTTSIQRNDHYDWCWNKTIEDFSIEGINFKYSIDLYDYFYHFMLFYFYEDGEKIDYTSIKKSLFSLWDYILGYSTNKTLSDVDTFLEVYTIFEKTR
jgi:hypothetical protein